MGEDGFLNKFVISQQKGEKNPQDFPEEKPVPVDLI